MKTQTTLENAKGKNLTGYTEGYSGQTLLIFGEEYVCLGIHHGYENGDAEIQEETLDILSFGDSPLIAQGVVTEDELNTLRRQRQAQAESRRTAFEKAEYERLKKLYEPPQ
jgi:hypothetical protein